MVGRRALGGKVCAGLGFERLLGLGLVVGSALLSPAPDPILRTVPELWETICISATTRMKWVRFQNRIPFAIGSE